MYQPAIFLMLNDDILKALLEGIIYVAPEPVTLDGMVKVLEGEERERVKAKLDELVADYEQNSHGIQIRQVANGYKFSTKAEHHEILRNYVKSLKPLVRLSKPALETLAVIAYRQPVTMPEIEEIRGVDSGGVIHTLLEKKLVVTSGRKSVVGRPILYRTSKDFLVHFGLKDVGELPSLKEFEELARRALGSEWTGGESTVAAIDSALASGAGSGDGTVESALKTPEPVPPPSAEESATTSLRDSTRAGQEATGGAAARSSQEPPVTEQGVRPSAGAQTGPHEGSELATSGDLTGVETQAENAEHSKHEAPATEPAAERASKENPSAAADTGFTPDSEPPAENAEIDPAPTEKKSDLAATREDDEPRP